LPDTDTSDISDTAGTEPRSAAGPAVADPPVGGDPARPRPKRRLHVATVLIATLGVVVALAGLAWGTRPLATPTQDCGTPFSFLYQGRLNVYVDPADPPAGVSAAEAEANNAEPCQERAADRARPAGALVVGGTLVGAVAAVTDLGVRSWRWFRVRPPRPPRA
jgi:hypothetical protein